VRFVAFRLVALTGLGVAPGSGAARISTATMFHGLSPSLTPTLTGLPVGTMAVERCAQKKLNCGSASADADVDVFASVAGLPGLTRFHWLGSSISMSYIC